jgi:hypothetical protein
MTTFFGLVSIGLLALIVSKLNVLQRDVERLREEVERLHKP